MILLVLSLFMYFQPGCRHVVNAPFYVVSRQLPSFSRDNRHMTTIAVVFPRLPVRGWPANFAMLPIITTKLRRFPSCKRDNYCHITAITIVLAAFIVVSPCPSLYHHFIQCRIDQKSITTVCHYRPGHSQCCIVYRYQTNNQKHTCVIHNRPFWWRLY